MTRKKTNRVTKKKIIQQLLSIYLVKKEYSHKEETVLIKTAEAKEGITLSFGPNGGETEGRLFIRKQKESKAKWIGWIATSSEVSEEDFGIGLSTSAAMVVYSPNATFVLTFGYGRFLVNEEVIERDFGLRMALKSMKPDQVRGLDKLTGEANPLHARTQSIKGGDVDDLLIDTEVDMLNTISGRVAKKYVAEIGNKVGGSDVLNISPRIEINELPQLLHQVLDIFNTPLPERYRWVDNVRLERNSSKIGRLNELLVNKLQQPQHSDDVWLGAAEIIEQNDTLVYAFTPGAQQRTQFLQLERLIEHIKQRKCISFEALSKQEIFAIDSEDNIRYRWKAFDCLHTQLALDDETFVLRKGNWFRVAADFVSRINDALKPIKTNVISLPVYSHDSEGQYNQAVANNKSMVCFDADNIAHGGQRSKIEFCDLFKDERSMIHVKRYSGSATLSHLFAQGAVSGQLFRADPEFRHKLNDKLPHGHKLKDVKSDPIAANYDVVFAIVTDKQLPQELPFFSKVTLKNAYTLLTALGYRVSLTQIKPASSVVKKVDGKPGKGIRLAKAA